ncbi:hypothetical protein EES43_22535 [Streptomyces sp. ADI96-02]|uniref:hypothetical protein n=1 Tax=Streptomyces sp. ADI96-02 TaxID=1522760 RepID=UPI000F54FFBE|nr:hypothetical protein [Streptomyces sp. ADI96-02]RPK57327.1 hypothetical protein EES43_22535 [Streptomyces sp. ADI96-02]
MQDVPGRDVAGRDAARPRAGTAEVYPEAHRSAAVVLLFVAELVRSCGRFTLADVVAARARRGRSSGDPAWAGLRATRRSGHGR